MGQGKCPYGNGRDGQGEEGEEFGGRHVESGGRDCGDVGCCRWFWMLMMVRRTEETERAAVTFLYSRSSPCSDGLKCQLLVGLQAPPFHSVLPAS